jgi:hypothetical protein
MPVVENDFAGYGMDPNEVLRHRDVQATFEHYRKGNFKDSPEVYSDSIYCFWSNDYEGGIRYGREVARRYRESHPRPPVFLMEDFEGARGVIKLDTYGGPGTPIPEQVRDAVAAFASYSYARSIPDKVLVSVKGSSFESFFRKIELDVIMNSERTTQVIIASRDDPRGTQYDKRIAYHMLRDEWLENSKNRFVANFAAVGTEPYNKALEDLAQEIVLARRTIGKDYPFSQGNPAKQFPHARYDASDRIKEQARIDRGNDIIAREIPVPHRDNLRRRVDELMAQRDEVLDINQSLIARMERAAGGAALAVGVGVVVAPVAVGAGAPSPAEIRAEREARRIFEHQADFRMGLRADHTPTVPLPPRSLRK